jgi:hypothetical protein
MAVQDAIGHEKLDALRIFAFQVENKSFVLTGTRSSPDTSSTTVNSKTKSNRAWIIFVSIAGVLIIGAAVYFFIQKKHL